MARPLVRWIGAALLGCAVCAAVYLPPRELPRWAWNSGRSQQGETVSRLRARRLAEEWREVNATLQGERHRGDIRAAITARRLAGEAGPVLVSDQADTLLVRTRPALASALDEVWSRLGMGESKVNVAVLIRDPQEGVPASLRPRGEGAYGLHFLLPDSVDRAICLSETRFPGWLRNRKHVSRADLQDWARTVVGLCAWYARFGVPSSRVEQWLARRRFDVALLPAWDPATRPIWEQWEPSDPAVREPWWMWQLYMYPRPTAGCFAGRVEACRRALVAADHGPEGPRPRVIVPINRWEASKTLLVGGENFLSAVMRKTGPDHFQEFWTTDLPVDSALSLALGEPVGEFVVGYQRTIGPAPAFGAATTPLDAGLGIGFAILVVGIVAAAQERREVR